MKTFKWFIVATSLVAFISCSSAYPEAIDEEILEDLQSRGETTQNDSTVNDSTGSGVNVTTTDWIKITEEIVVKEDPKQEVKNDSIPNDSIPSDSTKNEQAFKLK